MKCPNKKSKLYKLLLQQSGSEEKAFATWAFNNFDYPQTIRNTVDIMKAVRFKNELTYNEFIELQKRVRKYNRKNGTSHSFVPPKYDWQRNIYYTEGMIVNYLPVSASSKMVSTSQDLFSKQEEKAIINTHPEEFISREDYNDIIVRDGNQYFLNGDVYPTYGDALDNKEDLLPVGIKEGVSEVFENNSELAQIGTPEQYSQYLDQIFPDSKVKNIVRHDTDYKFWNDKLPNGEDFKSSRGIYFNVDLNQGGFIGAYYKIPAIINLVNPAIKDMDKDYGGQNTNTLYPNNDGVIGYSEFSNMVGEYVVSTSKQIHVLGSKTDIEGFKQYVSSKEDLMPDAVPMSIIGNTKKLNPKFQQVADVYIEKVKSINKTISKLSAQKKGKSLEEKIELEARINALKKRKIALKGSDEDASIKGKIDTILKLNALEDIEEFANEQLSEVEKIFEQDNISGEELDYARKVVTVWSLAGNFSNREHLFLDEDEIESIDTDLVDIKNKFITWRDRAETILRRFIIPAEEEVVKQEYKDTFGEEMEIDTAITDVGWLKSQVLDVTRTGNSVLKAMAAWVKMASYHANLESGEINDAIDELVSKINKVDWELFQQRYGNTDKRRTGNLVFRFSQEYYDIIGEYFDRARRITGNQQNRNKEFNKALQFLRDNTVIFDVRKLFPDNELWGKTFSIAEIEEHVKLLKDTLGEIGYEEFYSKAKEKVDKYKDDRDAWRLHLESTEENAAQVEAEMELWEKSNSPAYEAELIELGGTTEKVAGRYINPTGTYSVKVPKRIIDGKSTGYYDTNFEKIENDENLRNLYNYLFKTLNNLKQYIPEETNWMRVNSLPTIPLTMLEDYSKDGLSAKLTPVWDSLKESRRIADVPSETKGVVNPETGEVDKGLQTHYLVNYYDKIQNELSIAVLEYKKSHNQEDPSIEEYLEMKKDISEKLAAEKSIDLGKVTKAYAHMALSYKHKSTIQDVMKAGEAIVKRQVEQLQNNSGEPLTWHGLPRTKKGLPNIQKMLDTFMDVYWGYSMDKPSGKTSKKVYTAKEAAFRDRLITLKEQNEQDFKNGLIVESEYEGIKELIDDQLDVLGGVRAYSKFGDMILKYMQLKGMGWNVFAALTNLTYGFVSNIIEATDGRVYNLEDFWKAQGVVLSTIGGYNKFSPTGKKISVLMKKFDVMKDSKNELYKSTKSGIANKLSKITKPLNPYMPQSSTEFINQATVMMAIMYHTKVRLDGKETNLFEAYDEKGELKEGVEFVDKSMSPAMFKLRIDNIVRRNHGNYDPELPLNIKRTFWGRALAQFRTWAFEGFAERFDTEDLDPVLGMQRKGRYLSYGTYYKTMNEQGKGWINSTFSLSYQLLRKLSFGKYNTTFDEIEGFSEVDAANMRKNLSEIMVIAVVTALALMIKAAFKDDEDENVKYLAFFWINQLNRLTTDISFYTSPMQFEKLLRNAIPAFTLVVDTQKAVEASWNLILGGEDILQSGPNKGQSKAGRAIKRIIPTPLNALERIKSASTSIYADKPVSK